MSILGSPDRVKKSGFDQLSVCRASIYNYGVNPVHKKCVFYIFLRKTLFYTGFCDFLFYSVRTTESTIGPNLHSISTLPYFKCLRNNFENQPAFWPKKYVFNKNGSKDILNNVYKQFRNP